MRELNSDDGKVVRSYAGSGDFMYSTAVSADGQIAIAGGQDSVLLVWQIDADKPLKSFAAPKPAENPATSKTAGN